jgi:flagellar motor switch protein FliM
VNSEPLRYDFRSPSRFSREHIRALQMVNETYARQVATVWSTTLRIVAQTSLVSVGQSTYEEHTRRLPNPTLLGVLRFAPMNGVGLVQLPMEIVMNVIDRLLGGPGTLDQPTRALSEIETGLVRSLVQRSVRELTYAFEGLGPIQAEVQSIESDPLMLQLAPPNDPMIISEFEITLGETTAISTLCIPASTLQPVLEALDRQPELAPTGPQAIAARRLAERVTEVPVEVSVAFRPISLRSADLFDLKVGDVLPLRHPTNQPLTISADGVPVATAVPGSHGHRLACQIVHV